MLELSDITQNFRAAAMFLIVELQNIFYLHIPQVMYYLPPLNGKLNTDFTRLPV